MVNCKLIRNRHENRYSSYQKTLCAIVLAKLVLDFLKLTKQKIWEIELKIEIE
jgi:hypothetical protein